MRRRAAGRGFTLAEMLVALAVVGVVLTVVLAFALSQKGLVERGELTRVSNERGKEALLELERHLRLAGFGVDPRVAFDFDHFRCPVGVTNCRDSKTAPDSVVFNFRDPHYRIDVTGTNGCADTNGCPTGRAWRMHASTPPDLVIDARAGNVFHKGQVLLAVCPNGFRWTMGTVDEPVTVDADAQLALKMVPADAVIPYFENEWTHSCFGTGATVFAVKRYAYSIATFDGTPWLVRDEGLDLDGDGLDPWEQEDPDDLLPLLPGIEELQLAYLMNRVPGAAAVDTNSNFVVGDDPASDPEQPDDSQPAPDYRDGSEEPSRRNLHPANIRSVRLSLVIRDERADPSRPPGTTGDPLPLFENSTRALAGPDRFRRLAVRSTVLTRNLNSTGMFVF